MATQGQVAVAPRHIGTRALEHGGQPSGLIMEVVLRSRAQCTQNAVGFTQRGAKALSELAKGFTITDGASPGHAVKIVRRDELGVHGKGDRRRQVELSDLLPDITGDERNSRLHFRHHPLGFLDAFSATLAEAFVLGNGTNLLDMFLNIRGDEWAIAAYPAFKIDKVIVVADASDVRLDLCPLLRKTRVLTTGRCKCVLSLFQAYRFLWRATRSTLCGFLTRASRVALQPFALLFGLRDSLVSGPFFG